MLIENLMEQEEIFWLQRGRANWLRQADRNTSFFHHSATQRKKRNNIKRMQDDSGVWKEGADDLNNLVTTYFLFALQIRGLSTGPRGG